LIGFAKQKAKGRAIKETADEKKPEPDDFGFASPF
jgi:hypothetical protein